MLDVNEFADATFEEFSQRLSHPQADCSATTSETLLEMLEGHKEPKSQDWREKGIVSPVKNQGHCGSCWTFSTTGALEAAYALEFGSILSLSEQQLVDCAQAFDNHGCSGGLPSGSGAVPRHGWSMRQASGRAPRGHRSCSTIA